MELTGCMNFKEPQGTWCEHLLKPVAALNSQTAAPKETFARFWRGSWMAGWLVDGWAVLGWVACWLVALLGGQVQIS